MVNLFVDPLMCVDGPPIGNLKPAMERPRRLHLSIWGTELDVDLFMWTRMGGKEDFGEAGELGFEAIRINPDGTTECYIVGYEGAIAWDYDRKITPQEFQERIDRMENIAKNKLTAKPKPVEDVYHG